MKIQTLLISMFFIAPTATQAICGEASKEMKVIQWGWGEPDTRFIRENVSEMEKMPFDGLVFHVLSDAGENFAWRVWSPRRFALSEFSNAMSDLDATRFSRFTDRFLRVNVEPGNVDWFDDAQWNAVMDNFRIAAKLAKRGGCKGIVFDTEQYDGNIFDYSLQQHKSTKSFSDYSIIARQRGREWINAVNSEFADITIFLTYGYSLAGSNTERRAELHYGLLGSFLDGILGSASQATAIVDGWEGSYQYKRREQFQEARYKVTVSQVEWSSEPDKYRRQVSLGFGIWMDADWKKRGWHQDNFAVNYFTPAQFEASVGHALEISDKYVWIYSQAAQWWTNTKLPKAYVDALRDAQTKK